MGLIPGEDDLVPFSGEDGVVTITVTVAVTVTVTATAIRIVGVAVSETGVNAPD